MLRAICLLVVVCLTACSARKAVPPVYDRMGPPRVIEGEHVVMPDETLYSIAWRYGRDLRELSDANGIKPPYLIYPGQKISLSKKNKLNKQNSLKKSKKSTRLNKTSEKADGFSQLTHATWNWPAKGKIIKRFNKNIKESNGIDISGGLGAPIQATQSGLVVYSGSGLRGLGKLIIIKHDDQYLSAYAHNHKLLVSEGDKVKVGQKIAEMGRSGANSVKLHFEIRRNGRPVDPLMYLAKH